MSDRTRARPLCAVLLAAGAGTRLRPLTALRPKALCPVANVTPIDRWLTRLGGLGFRGPAEVAVNAHHHAGQIVDAVAGRAHVSVEREVALGTAGALGALRDWVAGRDVLVCNADAYLASAGDAPSSEVIRDDLLDGWTGERPRLLVVREPGRGDFGPWRFAGSSLLPAATAAALAPVPTGLYEVVWRDAHRRGALELTPFAGTFVDCGTPADYLAANLHAAAHAAGRAGSGPERGAGSGPERGAGSGPERGAGSGPAGAGRARSVVAADAVVTGIVDRSVVGAGAVVAGRVTRSVVWPGGRVGPGEDLAEVVRVGADLTVPARRASRSRSGD